MFVQKIIAYSAIALLGAGGLHLAWSNVDFRPVSRGETVSQLSIADAVSSDDIEMVSTWTAEDEERVPIEESGYIHVLVEHLGGAENLLEISSCITRLRLKVSDADKVDDAALKAMGAKGVIKKGTAVQVVIGTRAELIANEINASMKK